MGTRRRAPLATARGRIIAYCALATAALVAAGPAAAIPLVWTLQDVTLTDGQTLSGSFTYDYATGAFSNIAVTNSGTPEHPATLWNTEFRFSAPRPNSTALVVFLMSGPAGGTNQILNLLWNQYGISQGLDNDGGTVLLRPAGPPGSANSPAYLTCGRLLDRTVEYPEFIALPSCDGAEALQGDGGPFVAGGSLTAVPAPAAGWLLGTAVAGLMGRWWRRR
jgi:hypothetical protein